MGSLWGIFLSAVVVGILLFTGWKGGDLVYQHRIGCASRSTGAGIGSCAANNHGPYSCVAIWP
ncbi:DUF2231 domain-containing protein [Bradyrhizobium sp. 199]|nr:DUF2231 domain-containing protein [Bradyrhizobium sp. 199]